MSGVSDPLGQLAAEQMESIEAATQGEDGWEIAGIVCIVSLRNVDGRESRIRVRTLSDGRPLALGLIEMARHELLTGSENRP